MRIMQLSSLWKIIPPAAIAAALLLVQESASAASASVDHMRITVYYTAGAQAVPFFSWWSVPLMLLGFFWLVRREANFLTDHAS